MKAGNINATLNMAGTLVYKDKDGNVLKEVQFRGRVPLPGMTADEAKQLITDTEQQQRNHHDDNCN